MRRKLFTLAVLLACAGGAWADEKDAKPGTPEGPPPGKGWRKNEKPLAPAPKGTGTLEATPAPKGKGYSQTPAPKGKPNTPASAKDDGIGPQVSAWARSGIRGPQLAAKIHQLQATKAPAKPGKKPQEPVAPPMTPKKKKGGD